MTVKDLERLYEYGYWANRRLFQVVSQLTPEQFTQTVAGSYGSVRNTLVHVLSAEWGWLDRCGGAARGPALKPDDFPTIESVVGTWNRVEAHGRQFLSALKDEDLEHRGQVALLLRVLGFTPGNVDLLIYDAEQRGVPAF